MQPNRAHSLTHLPFSELEGAHAALLKDSEAGAGRAEPGQIRLAILLVAAASERRTGGAVIVLDTARDAQEQQPCGTTLHIPNLVRQTPGDDQERAGGRLVGFTAERRA